MFGSGFFCGFCVVDYLIILLGVNVRWWGWLMCLTAFVVLAVG